MTDEELAEEYEENAECIEVDDYGHKVYGLIEIEEAFLAGLKTGKNIKENTELKAQIEKMKCCHNCRKFHNLSYDCTCAEVCNEWEIKG